MADKGEQTAFPMRGFSTSGLSKREYIATQLYAAFLSRNPKHQPEGAAEKAVRAADHLIDILGLPQ